jgi:hypothetical protein
MQPVRLLRPLVFAAALCWTASAAATTIVLSSVSSDLTPASQLDAIVDFQVGDFDLGNAGDELQITLTNPSAGMGGDALFNLNEIYWNGSASVTGLTLLSAEHSVNGDQTALWMPVETGLSANGFGGFDFALRDGLGNMSPGIAQPGESIVFLLDIASLGPVTAADFVVDNANGYPVAVKFVNGPDDPEMPGFEDSAYGTVPEPTTGLLCALGLVGLSVRRRLGAR